MTTKPEGEPPKDGTLFTGYVKPKESFLNEAITPELKELEPIVMYWDAVGERWTTDDHRVDYPTPHEWNSI